MNELIKIKNKYKHKYKQYNLIPEEDNKPNEIISSIVNDMVETVIEEHDVNENVKINSNGNTPKNASPKNNKLQLVSIPMEENECRICFEEETAELPFIWPCRCKGTSKYVHESCLERWRYENIDNPAFEICMECRYKYRFSHEYPCEFHSQLPVNLCFISGIINIIPFIFTFIVNRIDNVNNYIIIKSIYGENNPIVKYGSLHPETMNSLLYCLYYNMILFVQCLFFTLFFICYVCKSVYRKKLYVKLLLKEWKFCFAFLFKFPLLYQTTAVDVGWLTIFITMSSIFIFLEPMFYIVFIKKHNYILTCMDETNDYSLRNYTEEDDIERQQQLIQHQIELQLQELELEYESTNQDDYIAGTVVSQETD